jgi:hypothetical protein
MLKRNSGHGQVGRQRRPKPRRNPARQKRSFVPRFESLEDRTVLSTLTVLNNHDSGPGSLRAEMAAAQNGDTIRFAPGLAGQTITLTSGEVAITKNLDIEGLDASQLTVSGNNARRIFDISGGVSATIAGLTITDGLADHGGGILSEAGAHLTLSKDTCPRIRPSAASAGARSSMTPALA